MNKTAHIPIPHEKLEEFCRRHSIRKLAVFGSVLRDDFRPDSDIDVLVQFEPDAEHSLFDFVRIQDELATLLGRSVDLVEETAIRNPFRRHEIRRTQQVIFGA